MTKTATKDYSINGTAPLNASELQNTETNGIKRDTRFKPGNKAALGNKQSRTRLSDKYLEDALAAWKLHGIDALNTMATKAPVQFCTMVAGILPKDYQVSVMDESATRWVISSAPVSNEFDWKDKHGLRDDTVTLPQPIDIEED